MIDEDAPCPGGARAGRMPSTATAVFKVQMNDLDNFLNQLQKLVDLSLCDIRLCDIRLDTKAQSVSVSILVPESFDPTFVRALAEEGYYVIGLNTVVKKTGTDGLSLR